ncbi:MAG: STAS domain-containing protein, partial [Chitinivibrionales bacterium]|nr:STAS domain-containing protein [Chitinivibrionales bacterium]MBD3358519.1 STAS domain-containing protein [Chitinivibrionales bacterium]
MAESPSSSPLPESSRQRTIAMPRRLTREWIESADIKSLKPTGNLRLDFNETERLDSSGASLLAMMNRAYRSAGHELILANIDPRVLDTLNKWTARLPEDPPPLERKQDPF